MSVKFEVKMTAKYMFDFMLYHNYSRLSGILGAVVGVFALGIGIQTVMAGDTQSAAIYFLCAILFLIITPYTMWSRAKMQVKTTPMFQKPLEYEFTEEGIAIRQDEQEAVNPWSEFTKAVSTNKSVILYLGRVRALVLPKECMGEQYEEAVKMIHTHMPPAKVKIRHIH